jgi:hypothetical protein
MSPIHLRYLTEQLFHQHLSRFDGDRYTSDDRSPFTLGLPNRLSETSNSGPNGFAHSSSFHLASLATISFRTPKHVFHTFGIFTIAAVVLRMALQMSAIGMEVDTLSTLGLLVHSGVGGAVVQ